VIVVLGRPALGVDGSEEQESRVGSDRHLPAAGGLPAGIALAAAAAGPRVELVGTIGDDADGDAVAIALGRAGVGHAALLRDPAGRTPRVGPPPGVGAQDVEGPPSGDATQAPRRDAGDVAAPSPGEARDAPRLDAEDVDLGLRYLADYRVLVLAEPLPPPAEAVALEAARYQGAAVIAVVPAGASTSERLRDAATVLEAPEDGGSAFAELVARYAVALDSGQEPRVAFETARVATGFERRA
jgi:hypothetical protein